MLQRRDLRFGKRTGRQGTRVAVLLPGPRRTQPRDSRSREILNRQEAKMDERRYTNRTEIEGATPAPHATRWLVVAIVGLIAMVGLALGYGYEQKQASSGVTSDDAGMTATI